MSFVLASALPAMAIGDTYTNFLKGVTGTLPATGVPTAEGGTWIREGVALTNSNGNVDFETSSSPLKLTNLAPGPADTNTIVKVELEVSVADVGELMATNDLTGAGAQTAFAVCTNAYHAWNGEAWVVLGDTIAEVGDDSQTTNLLVEIKYLGTNSVESGYVRAARFTIGDTTLVARGASTAEEQAGWVALATPSNNFTGFGASGSGLLSKVDAEVMLGVAEYAGIKYGTLGEAVNVASATLLDKPTVEFLRETDENITITNNVAIADNGKTSGTISVGENVSVTVQPSASEFKDSQGKTVSQVTAGEYIIPVNMTGGNLTVDISKSMPNKEVFGTPVRESSAIKVTIRTAKTVLQGAKPDGSKGLNISTAEKETALRNYLNAHAHDAYVAADVSSGSLQTALSTPRTGENENGLPLYQSYALGIAPTDPVKPVAVADDDANDGITLAIPAIRDATQSGDYTIRYQVDNGGLQTNAGEIKIPLTTGSHTVKIVFAEP